MGIIGAKKRRRPPGEHAKAPQSAPGPVQRPPGTPPPMNGREDAAVEQTLRAQGVAIDAPPAGDATVDVDRLIDSDASLFHRPQVRRLVKHLSTMPLTNLDGTPVLDKRGRPIPGTMWDAMVRSEVLRAVNGDEQARDFLLHTIFGKPREAMEFSGPAGGPIDTRTTIDTVPAEEIAAKLVRAQRIAQEVLARETARPALVGIEVSAKPPVATADEPDIKGAA